MKAEIGEAIKRFEAEISELREENDRRNHALAQQFGELIHGLEISLHDVSEEKENMVRSIYDLELSASDELQQTIDEIITFELRSLIERINATATGSDPNGATREQLRAELEEWLARIASNQARMNELNAKSLQSFLSELNIGGLLAAGQ